MSAMPACLVVGAADGVGSAIARAFAAEGLTVCMTRRARYLDRLDAILRPDEIAKNYVWLYKPQRSALTFAPDLRPWKETR